MTLAKTDKSSEDASRKPIRKLMREIREHEEKI
jgi:hypothetical protein